MVDGTLILDVKLRLTQISLLMMLEWPLLFLLSTVFFYRTIVKLVIGKSMLDLAQSVRVTLLWLVTISTIRTCVVVYIELLTWHPTILRIYRRCSNFLKPILETFELLFPVGRELLRLEVTVHTTCWNEIYFLNKGIISVISVVARELCRVREHKSEIRLLAIIHHLRVFETWSHVRVVYVLSLSLLDS